MKRLLMISILSLLIAGTSSCGGGGGSGGTVDGTSRITITIDDSHFAKVEIKKNTFFASVKYLFKRVIDLREASAIPANIVNIKYTISGPDMDTIRDVVPVSGETVTFTIDVPNGHRRHFLLEALDANGVVNYRGEADADLNGTPIILVIFMADVLAPSFGGISSCSVNATNITLSWSPATDNHTSQNDIVYLIYQATTPGG